MQRYSLPAFTDDADAPVSDVTIFRSLLALPFRFAGRGGKWFAYRNRAAEIRSAVPVDGSGLNASELVYCRKRPGGVLIVVGAASKISEVAEKLRNDVRTEVFRAR